MLKWASVSHNSKNFVARQMKEGKNCFWKKEFKKRNSKEMFEKKVTMETLIIQEQTFFSQ